MSNNLMKIALTLLLALAIPAFASTTADRIKAFNVEKAKERVADELSDPDSAKFRKLFLSEFVNPNNGQAGLWLCGEINAKNKMGGYVGYRQFFIKADLDLVQINPAAENEKSMEGVKQQMFDSAYPKVCSNSVKQLK
jgi:hypothetical protein